MLILGEVHTGLLQHSTPLTAQRTADALALLRGERIRRSDRPNSYAVSPDLLTGVDCRLASRAGTRTRAVGTVLSHGAITGGYVLQGSAYTRVVKGETDRRQPWSHYLSRPGVVETIGRVDRDDVLYGFTGGPPQAATLDLSAVSGRVIDSVQAAATPDRRPPFRIGRTRLRWVATTTTARDGSPPVSFSVDSERVRTVRLTDVADDDPVRAAQLCEDLALHDWLLTTLLTLVERSNIGGGDRSQALHRLRPAIDHLLHLWMPAARLDHSVTHLWDDLERRPGFTRQWRSLVDRIRDQVAISSLTLLGLVVDVGSPDYAGTGSTARVDR